jgi:hypothetical protein
MSSAQQRQIDQLVATVRALQARLDRIERPQTNSWIRSQRGSGEAGRFILLANPTGGATGPTGAPMTAAAQIVQADDPTIEIEASVTLYLDFDMFADLVEGDYGPAVKDARGKWMAANAGCNTSGGSS